MKTRIFLGSQIKVDKAVRGWAEALKDKEDVYCTTYRGKPVYLIAAGMRPTGGYAVSVELSLREENRVLFQVKGPPPGDFVIQILTYPYELVFSNSPLLFTRIDKQGESEVNVINTPPLD